MSKRTITQDDVTGTEIPDGTDPVTLAVTIAGTKISADLAPATADALKALLSGDASPEVMEALFPAFVFTAPPAKSARKSGSSGASGTDSAAIRAWLGTPAGKVTLDQHYGGKVPERGRFKAEVIAAYAASAGNGTKPAPAKPVPAKPVPAAAPVA